MSLRILLLLLFAVCAPVMSADTKTYFNCLRKGINDCAGDKPCKDGKCDCGASTIGHDCSINTPVKNCTNCPSGKSICNDNSTGCLCNPELYGPECQFNVYQAQCTNEGKMIININSPGVTSGLGVYIKGSPQCNKTGLSATNSKSNSTSNWKGIILEVPTNQSEECKAKEVNDNSTGQGYCVTLVGHFQKDYLTSLDFQVKFCCVDSEENITVGSATSMETDLPSSDVVTKPSFNDDLSSSMTDNNGQKIKDGGSKNLGDELRLKFQLKNTSSFGGLKVIRCEANDNGKNGKAVIFLDNGCLLPDMYIGTNISGPSEPPIMIEVVTKVIKFIGTDTVQFKCLVRICTDGKRCEMSDCTNGTVGRNKREAGNSADVDQGEIIHYVQVVTANSAAVNSGQEPLDNTQEPEVVIKPGYITAAVIGLAVVVLVLLLIIFVLAVCLCTRRAFFDVSKG